ncbi:hypothetical protein D3C71_36730 [compost metagenome]
MKQLSERALQFIEKSGRNKGYEINVEILEKHLRFYDIQDHSEIISFQNKFSGLHLQDIVIHIFTPKQIKENKGINTYHWKGQTLFSINDSFYIAENGEIAMRDCGCDSYDFYFYFERFETFVEQQTFFEEHRYYTRLPGLGNDLICNIDLLSEYFSDYEFIDECSDKYHRIWKNNVNLIHARLYPEGWIIFFEGISENKRHKLIEELKTEKIIV